MNQYNYVDPSTGEQIQPSSTQYANYNQPDLSTSTIYVSPTAVEASKTSPISPNINRDDSSKTLNQDIENNDNKDLNKVQGNYNNNYNEKRKRYCCCFKTKKGFIIFLILLIIFLIGIALTIFFCVPRIKTVDLGTPSLSSYDVSSNMESSSVLLSYPFSIDSKSYINYNVRWAEFKINPFDKDNNIVYDDLFGQGKVNDVVIRKHSISTFDVPTNITATRDKEFVGVGYLVDRCGSIGTVPIKYNLKLRLRGIAFPISLNGESDLQCKEWYDHFSDLLTNN